MDLATPAVFQHGLPHFFRETPLDGELHWNRDCIKVHTIETGQIFKFAVLDLVCGSLPLFDRDRLSALDFNPAEAHVLPRMKNRGPVGIEPTPPRC